MSNKVVNAGSILLGLLVMYIGAAQAVASLPEVEAFSVDNALQQAELSQPEALPDYLPKALMDNSRIDAPGWKARNAARVSTRVMERASGEQIQPPAEMLSVQEEPVEQRSTSGAIPRPKRLAVEIPVRLVIPAISLTAPVDLAQTVFVQVAGREYQQWRVPELFAAGWHADSARLGETGNTVLNGHHNAYGEVFRDLEHVQPGDKIQVFGQEYLYEFEVTNRMILPEKYEQLDVRMNNAQWLLPSEDERLTLITCWPYQSNTHRLILVAKPLGRVKLAQNVQ